MPASASMPRAGDGDRDTVDDDIVFRQEARARRSARAAQVDLLQIDVDFDWDAPRAASRRRRDVTAETAPRRRASRAASPDRSFDRPAGRRPDDDPLDRLATETWGAASAEDRPLGQPERPARSEADGLADRAARVALDPAADGRRTVVIRGRGAERYDAPPRHSYTASLRPHERSGFKPDRVAMWAVLLCLALLLAAATSSHAAVLAAHVVR